MRTVIVPEHAGVLSALGMLMADRVRDYSAGVLGQTEFEGAYKKLERVARKDMPRGRLERTMDVRYAGQSYELTVPVTEAFHAAHEKIYGYADPGRAIEVVAVRVRAVQAVPKLDIRGERLQRQTKSMARRMRLGTRWAEVPVWDRQQIGGGAMKGPLLVLDYGATTFVPAGWTLRRDRVGSLVISK
jgi:N-methylhydantoinase A